VASYARFKVMARSSTRRAGQVPGELRHQESLVVSFGLIKSALLSLFFLRCPGGRMAPRHPAGRARDGVRRLREAPGKGAKNPKLPTPAQIGETIVKNLSEPFYDRGPNDKGVGIQLAHSLGRVGLGTFSPSCSAVPLWLRHRHGALDLPGPRSLYPGPKAHLAPRLDADRALHHQDSSISGVFVIFICSVCRC